MSLTPKQHGEVLRRMNRWLSEAGINVVPLEKPEEGLEHHATFKYPAKGDTSFHLLRPKGRAVTVLASGTSVSPQHVQQLQGASAETRQLVVKAVRRVAFQGGHVGFGPVMQGEVITNWQLDIEIYDDALSEHLLFASLRALLTKHVELIDAFNEALGARQGSSTWGATGSSGYL